MVTCTLLVGYFEFGRCSFCLLTIISCNIMVDILYIQQCMVVISIHSHVKSHRFSLKIHFRKKKKQNDELLCVRDSRLNSPSLRLLDYLLAGQKLLARMRPLQNVCVVQMVYTRTRKDTNPRILSTERERTSVLNLEL